MAAKVRLNSVARCCGDTGRVYAPVLEGHGLLQWSSGDLCIEQPHQHGRVHGWRSLYVSTEINAPMHAPLCAPMQVLFWHNSRHVLCIKTLLKHMQRWKQPPARLPEAGKFWPGQATFWTCLPGRAGNFLSENTNFKPFRNRLWKISLAPAALADVWWCFYRI